MPANKRGNHLLPFGQKAIATMSEDAQAAQDAAPSAAASSSLLNDPHTLAQIYAMADDEPEPVATKAEVSRKYSSRKTGGMSMPKFGRRQGASLEQVPTTTSPKKK
eukprot:TRINITY_DN8318_c0_g1_i1.p1 TRINITY_DN8318_c0_g1~~TRINITY_DN8318_c0_g1_i1.p1  ORF type:complete len:106 (+),score=26.91 TRINITY_DN8318_c0_g1_i1:14-331(+)